MVLKHNICMTQPRQALGCGMIQVEARCLLHRAEAGAGEVVAAGDMGPAGKGSGGELAGCYAGWCGAPGQDVDAEAKGCGCVIA